MHNLTLSSIIKNIEESSIVGPVKRGLVAYARNEMQKSLFINIMDATALSGTARQGVNRWIERIDEAGITGVEPVSKSKETNRWSAGGRQPRRSLRMKSVDIPDVRSRSRSGSRGPSKGAERLVPVGEVAPAQPSGSGGSAGLTLGAGVGSTLGREAEYEAGAPCGNHVQDEGVRGKKQSRKSKEEKRVAKAQAKAAAKAERKEAEKIRREESRARKIKKGRGKVSSSDSEASVSSDNTGDSSSTDSSDDDSDDGSDKKKKKKKPIRFKVNKRDSEWNEWSAKEKAKKTMKWRDYIGKPTVWFQHYGRKLRLDESLSTAHAWKLTLCWATDLSTFGCNRDIMFVGKSAKELEEALRQTARKRNDYYSFQSAFDVAVETWIKVLPWLKKDILKYKEQLTGRQGVWSELVGMFAPQIYKALARLQAFHRYVMLALDMDPFKLPGDKDLLKKARKRYCTHASINYSTDSQFEPIKWLEPENQCLLVPPGPRPQVNVRAAQQQGGGSGGQVRALGGQGPEYCMDYNLSPDGCARAYCRFIHACSCIKGEPHICGGAGPYRLCPRGHWTRAAQNPNHHQANQGQPRRDVRNAGAAANNVNNANNAVVANNAGGQNGNNGR